MSIEEELWCIFTNYTLKSNPMEPATLPSRQFLKLARETQLAVTARDLADAHIAISSQLSVGETFRRLGRKGKALTYSDFVAVLFQLAPKCHPSVDASFAFQKVLLENVLPLAQRRSVYSVESVLAEDEIKDLLGRQFARGIDGIFDWCVTMANSSQHAADRGGLTASMRATMPELAIRSSLNFAKRSRYLKDRCQGWMHCSQCGRWVMCILRQRESATLTSRVPHHHVCRI